MGVGGKRGEEERKKKKRKEKGKKMPIFRQRKPRKFSLGRISYSECPQIH